MKAVKVADYLKNRDEYQLIDVRSPGEYHDAHIPGAVNVPLFTDEERAEVGTVFKQKGTDCAKEIGLEIVSAHLPQMVRKILAAAQGRKILLYCWRGGMRSRSMCSFMEALKYPVWQLLGGYKAFRRYINHYHEHKTIDVPVFVLNGLTGVGKTRILTLLQAQGYPVIDLEGKANHRGSAFGSVGLGRPRSQKDFDALLAFALQKLAEKPYLIVEGEGKRIGPVHLPDYFFEAMNRGPHILLEADLSVRAQRIVEEYHGCEDTSEELAAAVLSLQKKLGKQKSEEMAAKIIAGDYYSVVYELCQNYYDKHYRDSRRQEEDYLAVVNVNNLRYGTDKIATVIDNHMKNS